MQNVELAQKTHAGRHCATSRFLSAFFMHCIFLAHLGLVPCQDLPWTLKYRILFQCKI